MLVRPDNTEFAPFQEKYINLVPDDVLSFLAEQKETFLNYIDSRTEEQLNYKYALDKWTVKDVIMHIVDTETIFMYRALCMMRRDMQELPGFDHNAYVDNLDTASMSQDYLKQAYDTTRSATLCSMEQITDDMWTQRGNMSGYQMSLRAMPYMIAGHLQHHLNILKERYI